MARSKTFAGVEIHPDGSIRYGDAWQNTSSCHAEVETVGSVRDRATLTRVVGGALVAGPVGAVVGGLLRKRVDETEAYLLITGEKDWVVRVPTHLAPYARGFAAAVNDAARAQTEDEAARREADQAQPYRRTTGVYRPGLR